MWLFSSGQTSSSAFSKRVTVGYCCSEKSCPQIVCKEFKKPGAIWGKHKSEVLSFVSSNKDMFPGEGTSFCLGQGRGYRWRSGLQRCNNWDCYQHVIPWVVTMRWKRRPKILVALSAQHASSLWDAIVLAVSCCLCAVPLRRANPFSWFCKFSVLTLWAKWLLYI